MPQETGPLTGAGDWLTTQYLDEPTGTLGRTLARSNIIAAALGTLTSGTVYVSRLLLPRGIPVANVNILSNTTAEATGKTTPYANGAAIGALTAGVIHFYATVS